MTYNAIFQISIDRNFDGVAKNFHELETYINPRLFQIIKMNQNNLDALNHDLFLDSLEHDSYYIEPSKRFGKRIIQNIPIESYIMNELIESLDDIKIIKSTLYNKKKDGYGFSNDGKELELPLKTTISQKIKKNTNV